MTRAKPFLHAVVLGVIAALLIAAPGEAKRPVVRKGTVMLLHGDDLRHGREVDLGPHLKSSGRMLALPERAERYAGKRVIARGYRREGRIMLRRFRESPRGATRKLASATTSAVSGTKRVAVILFNFADDTSQPFTPASVAQTYFGSGSGDRSVAGYYDEVSWGQLKLTGQSFGWYTIPASSATCDPGTWARQADAAVQAAGVDLSGFNYKTYVYPGSSDCPWGGLGQMPGNQNWINGSPSVGLMIHELGHNLGLNHAIASSCTLANGVRVSISSSCSSSEYGDVYDVMGAAGMARHISAWHRAMLGLATNVQTVSSDGTYTLSPAESLSSGPQDLRIPRGDGSYLDLEFRQPYGLFDPFPADSPAVGGVMVRKVMSYSIANKPMLLDATPQTASFNDAPLAPGQVFADEATGITIKTLSVSPAGAQVEIKVRTGDFTPPEVTVASPADGAAVSLPAIVNVSASDNVGIDRVELFRNGKLVATQRTAPYAFSWVDGTSGSYTLYAVAYDTAGISAASPTVTVSATQTDTVAPTAPSYLRSTANGQTSIATTWSSSTDDVDLAYYRVFRNGVAIDTTTSTSYNYPGLSCGVTYTLSVAAVDTAGNSSPRSWISPRTNACDGDTEAPSMPVGVRADATGPTSVALAWEPSSDNVGVANYRIDRNGVTIGYATSTAFTDRNVVAGTRYSYNVTAYDAAKNASGTSSFVFVTMPDGDTQAPSVPAGLQASATSSSSIALSWQASSDNSGVAGYQVYRGSTLIGRTSSTSFTDSGLSAETAYTYTVSAYDTAGNTSAASSPATATTRPAADTEAPTPPSGLKASALKGRKVGLAWAPATDNVGVASYTVYRDGTKVATLSGGATGYTDSPSRGNHDYYVIALDAAGNKSPGSNTVTIKV